MSNSVPTESLVSGSDQARDSPAVGIVVTENNIDRMPGVILQARRHGHDVVLTARTEHIGSEAFVFARALNATVVEPPKNWTAARGPKKRLSAAAREAGYPGLIYVEELSDRINFEASLRRLMASGKFALEAEAHPAVDPEPHVLVGIPAYNERQTIGSVVEGARQYADEVLVVDDGSTDGTATRARAAGATVVEHDRNRGYGAALKTLFTQAQKCRADQLVVVDGDGQHDMDDIPRVLDTQQESGAEVVIGCRYGGETTTTMPLYRRFGLGVVNLLTNFSLGMIRPSSHVSDTQSGFRAYNSQAIESLANDSTIGDHMDASTDILYHVHSRGFRIEEIPITIDYTVDGASSHNPLKHGIVLVMNIVRTIERERPITVLGVPGVVCSLLGFSIGYLGISEYVRSGVFPIGIALSAAVLVMVGLLAAFTAILLHSLELTRRESTQRSGMKDAADRRSSARDTDASGAKADADSPLGHPDQVD